MISEIINFDNYWLEAISKRVVPPASCWHPHLPARRQRYIYPFLRWLLLKLANSGDARPRVVCYHVLETTTPPTFDPT